MKRTKLAQRQLPYYTKGEETGNMITHIVGGGIGIVLTILGLQRCIASGSSLATIVCTLYCISLLTVFSVSSIYHGLHQGMGKKVLQVLDHCMIYLLIAGTYTPILVLGFMPLYPGVGLGLLLFQWSLAIIAGTLTAIDMEKHSVFSMLCYIGMGWAIAPFLGIAYETMSPGGFWLLLSGGLSYTVGAVFFCFDTKVHWMHFVFHIFVIGGSILHFLSIYLYLF